MTELSIVFISGFLGSSHCIGMCGPFALVIGGASPSWHSNLLRQLSYGCGRIFTYTTLGAIAGFAGMRLANVGATFVNVPSALAIVAGVFLVYQGALTAGLIKRRSTVGAHGQPCLAGTLLGSFLRGAGKGHFATFLAGVFTGFLPCGLVYAFLTLAAGTADLVTGAATMAAFGLGTIPIMTATGYSGSLLSMASRKRLFAAAAWCVMLSGFVSIARGVGFIDLTGSQPVSSSSCPFCTEDPLP